MPNFAVVKHCFLDAFSGDYQLCTAFPWEERGRNHGVLHVRSVPFTLGYGDLTFQANGGDKTVPPMVNSTYPVAVYGEGTLGIALTRVTDDYRVLSAPVRSRRFWLQGGWKADELLPFYGEKFVIDIYDYRCCDWGWLAVDAFVIPALFIEIIEVVPSGGLRAGGTEVEIIGKGFGSTPEGVTVFIGSKVCLNVAMTNTGSLRCTVPPGEGKGLTVSVVIGDHERNVERGPFGGHQAGHCGAASRTFPYSDCRVGQAPGQWGVPLRGFTYRDPPVVASQPRGEIQEDALYMYSVAASDPDGDRLVYAAKVLPSWLRFDPRTQLLAGTPRRSDVRCKSDKWHPARDRCKGGGQHRVVLTASDFFYVVEQEFTITVQPRDSPILRNDRSFHWPTLDEHVLVRRAAQAMRYHTRAPDALAMQRYGHAGRGLYGAAHGFTYESLTGRDTVEAALRSMVRALQRETRPSPSEAAALVEVVEASGYGNALADVTTHLALTVRKMEETEALSRAAQLSVHGQVLSGWLGELNDLLASGHGLAPASHLLTLREPARCLPSGEGVLAHAEAAKPPTRPLGGPVPLGTPRWLRVRGRAPAPAPLGARGGDARARAGAVVVVGEGGGDAPRARHATGNARACPPPPAGQADRARGRARRRAGSRKPGMRGGRSVGDAGNRARAEARAERGWGGHAGLLREERPGSEVPRDDRRARLGRGRGEGGGEGGVDVVRFDVRGPVGEGDGGQGRRAHEPARVVVVVAHQL